MTTMYDIDSMANDASLVLACLWLGMITAFCTAIAEYLVNKNARRRNDPEDER